APRVSLFQALSLASFALLALFLAVVGIYGVVSFGVVRRITEFGIRMAVGARPSDVVAEVVKRGALMAVVGVARGLVAVAATLRLIQSMLFGVRGVQGVVVGVAIVVVVV